VLRPCFCVAARRAWVITRAIGCGSTSLPLEPQLFGLRRCALVMTDSPRLRLARGVDGRPTPPGVKEPLERGEEHRIIQQGVHPSQLHRQPPQLLRQESLPERRLISYRATRMVLTPSSARGWDHSPLSAPTSALDTPAFLGRSNGSRSMRPSLFCEPGALSLTTPETAARQSSNPREWVATVGSD
jgi:hypothetical protein